jgi:hypothetical protein
MTRGGGGAPAAERQCALNAWPAAVQLMRGESVIGCDYEEILPASIPCHDRQASQRPIRNPRNH